MTVMTSFHRAVSTSVAAILALALMSSVSQAQQSFPSPEDAAAALAVAVKSGPRDVLKVLGRAADDIVSSGDEVADADTRLRFTSMYDAKHSIKAEGNKKATLMLGADDFRSRFHSSTPGPAGFSMLTRAASRSCIVVSAVTSSTRSRPASPMSMPRTNTPTRIAVRAGAFMRSGSYRRQARRMGCSGVTIAIRAHSAHWSRRLRPKATRPVTSRRLITVTISGY